MDYKKSLEIVEKALTELKEENNNFPIIVEGEKDIQALKKLGFVGEILSLNAGVSIIDFCDNLSKQYKKIIILTDWDRKGGQLGHMIKRNLSGRIKCSLYYREIFAKNTVVKTVEGLPSWLEKIKEKIFLNEKI